MTIEIIKTRSDNYSFIIDCEDGSAAVIDPGEAFPIIEFINNSDFRLSYILNTHHHYDHTSGNGELKEMYGCKIIAPEAEKDKIGNVDLYPEEGTPLKLGNIEIDVINTPGHTFGSVCYYYKRKKALFTGDTLFSMGCGKLFEGSAKQLWDSFSKIMALPDDTKIYCGHEYTLENGDFCSDMEPENSDIKKRIGQSKQLISKGIPTIPSTLLEEKKTNSFLRAKNLEEFTRLRTLRG